MHYRTWLKYDKSFDNDMSSFKVTDIYGYIMKLYVSTPDIDGSLTVVDLERGRVNERLRCVSNRTVGEIGKTAYVQKILRFTYNGQRLLVLGRRGGTLEMFRESEELEPLGSWHGNTKDDKDFFVSIVFWNGNLCSCSSRGLLVMRNIDTLHSTNGLNAFYVQLNEPITVFKPHSREKWWAITGGYSNNLRIYNFANVYESFVSMVGAKGPQISKAILTAKPIWKACLHWTLDRSLEDFPWIQEVIFLLPTTKQDSHGTEICCTTKFGQIIVYDSSQSYYPISTTTVSNHPVCYVCQISAKLILFADCADTVGIFDLTSHKVRSTFRIPTGSLSSMEARISQTDNSFVYLAVVSILKELRIYRLNRFGGGADLLFASSLGSTGLQLLMLQEENWDVLEKCRALSKVQSTIIAGNIF